MLLRFLVSQYVRQAAEQKLHEVVRGAASSVKQPSEEGEDAEPPLEPEVLFFFATSTEAGGLMDSLQDRTTTQCATFKQHVGRLAGRPVGIIETGIGATADQAIDDALTVHRPSWAVAAGFATAIQPELRRGEILMADEVTNHDASERLEVGLKMSPENVASVRGLRLGRLTSVDAMLPDRQAKCKVAESSEALACDMEALLVARRCRERQTRFLSVHVITDALDDRLPPELEKMFGQESIAGKIGAAAGAIFNRPSSVKDMWNLKEQAIRAGDRLAKYLTSMLPQLA